MLPAYELLKEIAKKPETRGVFIFFIFWGIVGIVIFSLHLYHFLYATVFEPYSFALMIALLLWFIIFAICFYICTETYSQCTDMEYWVYFRIRSEWKFTQNHNSTLFLPFSLASLLAAILSAVLRIIFVLALLSALGLLVVLWFSCKQDLSKFGEILNNYMSIILVLIFIAQAWIFYQQYRHMKHPLFKTSLFWAISKSNSDTDCCILLKNGENVPIFNISYSILEVLVKDGWVWKKVKSEKISQEFLPMLDGGSEKKIFEKPTEEFKEMRLAVHILNAETLDGHSMHLSFYKARGAMDFYLAGMIYT